MIALLLLGGILGNGLLQMFADAVPAKHRFTYQVVVSALGGLAVLAAGVLLLQQAPWTMPEDGPEDVNTHGGRGGIVVMVVSAAIGVGPQITGLVVLGFGLLMWWPLVRDRLQARRRRHP